MAVAVRRAVTPVVFALVVVLMLLPFVSYRVPLHAEENLPATHMEISYDGLAPALGRASTVTWSTERVRHSGPVLSGHGNAREFSVAALVLLALGVAVALVRDHRVRTAASAVIAFLAGLALLVATLRTYQALGDYAVDLTGRPDGASGTLELRYGFWLAVGLLALVGFANVAATVPLRSPEPKPAGSAR